MVQECSLLPVLGESRTQTIPVVAVLLLFSLQSLDINLAVQLVIAVFTLPPFLLFGDDTAIFIITVNGKASRLDALRQLVSCIIAVPFGTAAVLLFEQAIRAQVIGIPLPCAVSVLIGQAVHGIIAVGNCHFCLFPACIHSASLLPRPVAVQVIEHKGIVKQTFFRTVTAGQAADIAVFVVSVTGSDTAFGYDLFSAA